MFSFLSNVFIRNIHSHVNRTVIYSAPKRNASLPVEVKCDNHFSSQQSIQRINLSTFTAHIVHCCCSSEGSGGISFNNFCSCFFCLSLIRTCMVQVQNQAQEQELFPPVKWVWVTCVLGFSGAFKKNLQRLCKLVSVSCQWTFTSFLFLFSSILFLHFPFSWVIPDSLLRPAAYSSHFSNIQQELSI